MKNNLWVLLVLAFALLDSSIAAAEANNPVRKISVENIYKLGTADKIEITVFNNKDLSGKYTLDGSGGFSMPLIGAINSDGLTVPELERAVEQMLMPDYLLNPKVNIQVLNYRPYYILGEVSSPGSYPYVDGMTYLNAIAIAGGFTEWADKDDLIVVRADGDSKREMRVRQDGFVLPGDTIKVKD